MSFCNRLYYYSDPLRVKIKTLSLRHCWPMMGLVWHYKDRGLVPCVSGKGSYEDTWGQNVLSIPTLFSQRFTIFPPGNSAHFPPVIHLHKWASLFKILNTCLSRGLPSVWENFWLKLPWPEEVWIMFVKYLGKKTQILKGNLLHLLCTFRAAVSS